MSVAMVVERLRKAGKAMFADDFDSKYAAQHEFLASELKVQISSEKLIKDLMAIK